MPTLRILKGTFFDEYGYQQRRGCFPVPVDVLGTVRCAESNFPLPTRRDDYGHTHLVFPCGQSFCLANGEAERVNVEVPA